MQAVRDGLEPSKINAVVLLSDGMCEDDPPGCELEPLLEFLGSTERETVRVFQSPTVRMPTSKHSRRSPTPRRRLYLATDPLTIERVFQSVISNFERAPLHRLPQRPPGSPGRILAKATVSPAGLVTGAALAALGLLTGVVTLPWAIGAGVAAWITSVILHLRDPKLVGSLLAPQFDRDHRIGRGAPPLHGLGAGGT